LPVVGEGECPAKAIADRAEFSGSVGEDVRVAPAVFDFLQRSIRIKRPHALRTRIAEDEAAFGLDELEWRVQRPGEDPLGRRLRELHHPPIAQCHGGMRGVRERQLRIKVVEPVPAQARS
jgi:hypothetical protein